MRSGSSVSWVGGPHPRKGVRMARALEGRADLYGSVRCLPPISASTSTSSSPLTTAYPRVQSSTTSAIGGSPRPWLDLGGTSGACTRISAPFQGAPILLLVPGVRAAGTSRLDPRMQDPAALTPGYDSLHRYRGATPANLRAELLIKSRTGGCLNLTLALIHETASTTKNRSAPNLCLRVQS